jgi:hypothetical protein
MRNFLALVTASASAILIELPSAAGPQTNVAKVAGLVVVEVKPTMIEGKNGIEVTLDKSSAERLLRFSHGAVGKHMTFFVNQKKLATLRLLDPIENGNVLFTGDLDTAAVEDLFASGAVIDAVLAD